MYNNARGELCFLLNKIEHGGQHSARLRLVPARRRVGARRQWRRRRRRRRRRCPLANVFTLFGVDQLPELANLVGRMHVAGHEARECARVHFEVDILHQGVIVASDVRLLRHDARHVDVFEEDRLSVVHRRLVQWAGGIAGDEIGWPGNEVGIKGSIEGPKWHEPFILRVTMWLPLFGQLANDHPMEVGIDLGKVGHVLHVDHHVVVHLEHISYL